MYRLAIAGMLFTTMSLTATLALRRANDGLHAKHAQAAHAMNCTSQLQQLARLAMPIPIPMLPALPELPPAMPPPPVGEMSLVHVAPGMTAVEVLHLIKMSLDEHVHAVDGVLVPADDAARVLLGHAGQLGPMHPMMDIAIDGAHSERHVVVFANTAP